MNFKRIFFKFLRRAVYFLPRALRQKVFRALIRVPKNLPKELVFKVAESRDEIEQAFKLVHDTYVDRRRMQPNAIGMRYSIYHCLPSTAILVVKWKDEVIATATLIRDNKLGLPCESVCELSHLRGNGQRLVEASGVGIKKEFRGQVMLPLIRYIYEFSSRSFGSHRIVLSLFEEKFILDYYECLGFKLLPKKPNGNYTYIENPGEVSCLLFDYSEVFVELARLFGPKPLAKNLFVYFAKGDLSNFVFPRLDVFSIHRLPMSLKDMFYFYREVQDYRKKLGPSEVLVLKKVLSHSVYGHIFSKDRPPAKPLELKMPRNFRFEVEMPGVHVDGHGVSPIRVTNASSGGFCATNCWELPEDRLHKFRVTIGTCESLEVCARKIWSYKNDLTGFEVDEQQSPAWSTLIERIRKENTIPLTHGVAA